MSGIVLALVMERFGLSSSKSTRRTIAVERIGGSAFSLGGCCVGCFNSVVVVMLF
jgi:hypothetical protein